MAPREKTQLLLNYTFNYSLHLKLLIFLEVNSKLDVGVQIVYRVIVLDTKLEFKKFKVQSII